NPPEEACGGEEQAATDECAPSPIESIAKSIQDTIFGEADKSAEETKDKSAEETKDVKESETEQPAKEDKKMDELKEELKEVLQMLKEKEEACAAAQAKVQDYKSMAKTAAKCQREVELAFSEYQARSAAKDDAQVIAHRVLDEWKKREEAMKASSFSFDGEIKTSISEITDYCQNESDENRKFCQCDILASVEGMLASILGDLDADTTVAEEKPRSKSKKKA
ncbi:hypothetical protein THAOC_03944, partial [Thalassiosira oceanica]